MADETLEGKNAFEQYAKKTRSDDSSLPHQQ
jgi:hypothetical protein